MGFVRSNHNANHSCMQTPPCCTAPTAHHSLCFSILSVSGCVQQPCEPCEPGELYSWKADRLSHLSTCAQSLAHRGPRSLAVPYC